MKYAVNLQQLVSFTALFLGGCALAAAQQGCFRSAAAAVKGSGPEDADGFRVEAIRHNALNGLSWAQVRSCAHPEWPLRLVRAGTDIQSPQTAAAPALVQPVMVLRAGTPVTVLSLGEFIHLQISGVAIEAGALGQRVRVRIAGDGEEHFIAGLVKSPNTLEMVR